MVYRRHAQRTRSRLQTLALIAMMSAYWVTACKNPTAVTSSPDQSQTAQASDEPGPLANDANDQELRRQFLATVAKYRAQSQREFGLTASQVKLNRDRRPKALNIKMRAPTAMIAKTAGIQGAGDQGAAIRAAGGKIRKELASANLVSVTFPEAADERHMAAVMEFLGKDHRAVSVEPDYYVKIDNLPNDPRFSELWGLRNTSSTNDINVTPAWEKTIGSRNVVVGIIDTGIDCGHQDLAANCWVNSGEDGVDGSGKNKRTNGIDDDANGYIDDWQGWNFITETNNATDDNRHGTHVAGTIGAVGNNNVGVVGVNWQVSLVPLKFLDASGGGFLSDAIEAIDYATKMKFFATNNSWGGGPYSDLMLQAIERANTAGILFVAAAGNHAGDNDKEPSYPASYESTNIIAVAATNSSGRLTSFSCFGKTSVDVAAPGDAILSTVPGGSYASLRGTSMATPHVTGALALLKSQYPAESAATLRNRLFQTVTPLSDSADLAKIKSGGIINVTKAILSTPDITPPSPPSNLVVTSRDLVRKDTRGGNYAATMRVYISFQGSVDNDPSGKAKAYQLRISPSRITDENTWANATPLTIESVDDSSSDSLVKAVVIDAPLSFNGFVAARAYDNSDNQSAISVSAKFKTINFDANVTYDASDPINYGFGWVIEDDPIRGKVYSDAIGSYPNNANTRMTLRTFSIPDGFSRLALRYWTRYSIDSWASSFWGPSDFGRVYIHGLGSSPWKIDEVSGYSGWTQRTIDLTDLAWEQKSRGNDSFVVIFELASDADSTDSGWLVDDIEILVNDTLIRTQGVPQDIGSNESISIQFATFEGALYSARLMDDGFKGCAIANYNEAEPSTPVTSPLVLNLGSKYGFKSLCVKARVPGITNFVYLNHRWMHESAASIVEGSGYPVGTNNIRSFPLKVKPSVGSSATHYKYALTTNYDNTPLDQICYKQPPRVEYSDWIPISQVSTVNVPVTQGYINNVLCILGKAPDGATQLTPRSYSWFGDYEAPQVQIINPPQSTNKLSSLKITLTSSELLSTCKINLTKNPRGVCPPVTEGYTDCSSPPLEHTVTVQEDGDYRICVYGVDKVGNVSGAAASTFWRRDATPPTVELSGTPPTNSKSQPAKIYIKIFDVLFYQFAIAAKVESCTAWSAKTLAHLPITLSIIPGGDGPRVLCVKGIDHMGNEQVTPSVMSWIQDTVAQPISFTGLPGSLSSAQSLNVGLSASEAGTYSYAVVAGSICPTGTTSWSASRPISRNITDQLPVADGTYTLCAIFTDLSGNSQQAPSTFTWTKSTKPPAAIVTSGLPMSPNSATTIAVQVGGANVSAYRYALLKSWNSNCQSGVTYGSWNAASFPLTEVIPSPSNNFMTLCVVAKDRAENIQTTPTIYRWLRFSNAAADTPAAVFATISVGARRGSSQTINLTRARNATATETATSIMCRVTPATGAVGSCVSRTVSFRAGQVSASTTFNNMSSGTWVNVLLPQQPARGRAEPLVFNF